MRRPPWRVAEVLNRVIIQAKRASAPAQINVPRDRHPSSYFRQVSLRSCRSSKGFDYFRDISTYGGCAGATVAALESPRIIEEENLVENSRVVGQYLLERLQALSDMPLVGHVRGKGLFCGLESVKDKVSKEPVTEAEMGRLMGLVAAEGGLIGRTNSS